MSLAKSLTTAPVTAMILAAGRGKRLRPITDSIPKPLVALCGKPLIEYHIEKLAKAGVEHIVINHAWLGHKLEETLGNGSRWNIKISYSPEPEGGLETAGGIINALPLIGSDPFLVINGDIYSEMDYTGLVKQAIKMQLEPNTKRLGHLVLVPSPEHNAKGDFGLDSHKYVTEHGEYTFAGFSILHPKLFAGLAVDFLPLAPILRKAMQKQTITGQLENALWSDIGTIERLQATEAIVCP
ncbi:nucleotidyltransferase family protein [Thiomicrorhabdus hydrogeniphila]